MYSLVDSDEAWKLTHTLVIFVDHGVAANLGDTKMRSCIWCTCVSPLSGTGKESRRLWYLRHGFHTLLLCVRVYADCAGHSWILGLPHGFTSMHLIDFNGHTDWQTSCW